MNYFPEIKRYQLAFPDQPKAFIITLDEILDLCTQGVTMKAIRIYLGQDERQQLKAYIIACVQDENGEYNDYNIPVDSPKAELMPKVKAGVPCPVHCGETNILNK